MDQEILKSFGVADQATQNTIEHVQTCILIYEETLKAMGMYPRETVSQAVDNAQLSYAAQRDAEGPYADLSDSY